MNKEQSKAANALRKALDNCHEAGLVGGVYDGSFCLWPLGGDPHAVQESGENDFFGAVKEECEGEVLLLVKMHLDGGAGN